MDREILFKGKRIDTEEWIEGYYFKMDETTYAFAEDYEKYPVPVHHYIVSERMSDWGLPNRAHFQEVKPETVCQYTGLTDRNDRKIFEGDILSGKEYHDYGQYGEDIPDKCVVKWNPGHAAYAPFFRWNGYNNKIEDYEVIGNIFDNPEFLQDNAGSSCERK